MNKSPLADADESRSIAALSTKVISPKASVPSSAVIVTAAAKALLDPSRIIFDPVAPVIKVAAPVIVRVPVSVIFPVVDVALKVPPTVVAPRARLLASVTMTLPDPVPEIERVPTSRSKPCDPPESPMFPLEVRVRVPEVVSDALVSSSSLMVLLEIRATFLEPKVNSSKVIAPEVKVDADVPAPSEPFVVA